MRNLERRRPQMPPSELNPEHLLSLARAGDQAALGRLLELYRNYLRLIARSLLDGALQARLDRSDLVQETFLKAHRDFDQFAGATEPELVAWLRQILVRNVADGAKRHRRQGRELGQMAATTRSAGLEPKNQDELTQRFRIVASCREIFLSQRCENHFGVSSIIKGGPERSR